MSTIKQIKVYRGYSNIIKLRAAGYWDKIVKHFYVDKEHNTYKFKMEKYDGLEYYIDNSLSPGIVFFRDTVLPWKWDYNKYVENAMVCLMPAGQKYNVEVPTYAYNGSFQGSLNFDSTTSKLSGFSINNYFKTITSFAVKAHQGPWEIKSRFKLRDVNIWNALFGGESGTYLPDLYVNAGNVLQMNLSSNGREYDIATDVGTYILSAYVDYWVKFGWTGTEYYAELSEDGVNYHREITINSSIPIESTTDKLFIGYRVGSFFHGEVYLNETVFSFANFATIKCALINTITNQELPGCLYNCTVSNTRQVLNAFVLNGDESIVLTPDAQYGNCRYLGKVTIPPTNGGQND